VIARSFRGAVPQGYMTGEGAKAACEEAGKRLCTDTEWLRACRGPDGTIFPYGNTRETGVCNDHRDVHPAVELFGSVTNLTSPCINELHDTVDLTGSRSGCTTVRAPEHGAHVDRSMARTRDRTLARARVGPWRASRSEHGARRDRVLASGQIGP
jgi:hypothetical protein